MVAEGGGYKGPEKSASEGEGWGIFSDAPDRVVGDGGWRVSGDVVVRPS